MQYAPSLIEARLIKRYKRFLADVYMAELPDGAHPIECDLVPIGQHAFTAHCANPGGMRGLVTPHQRAWLYDSNNPKRKLRYSLELVETAEGAIVCVNTARANTLVGEAILGELIPTFNQVTIQSEVTWGVGEHRSRFDFAFWEQGHNKTTHPTGYLEVKSVTHAPDPIGRPGVVAFPDAVTARGLKHLEALIEVIQSGQRAVLCFCVNRDDATEVTIADHIDPAYAKGMRRALEAGLEVIAVKTEVSSDDHKVVGLLPFYFN